MPIVHNPERRNDSYLASCEVIYNPLLLFLFFTSALILNLIAR